MCLLLVVCSLLLFIDCYLLLSVARWRRCMLVVDLLMFVVCLFLLCVRCGMLIVAC